MARRTDGSVFRRQGTDSWIAKLKVNGRDVRHSAPTQQAAIRELAKMRRERDAGLDTSRLTVADYLTSWLERKRADGTRVNTLRSYESKVRAHLVPLLGWSTLTALTPQDVEDATRKMIAAGSSARNAAHVRVVLANALHDAERRNLVSRNVAALARAPHVSPAKRQALDATQVGKLLASLEGHDWQAVYALAATLGLRQGEALALQWADVSDDSIRIARTVRIVRSEAVYEPPKSASSRRALPLTPALRAMLHSTRARQLERRLAAGAMWHDEGLVFAGSTGGPLRANMVLRALYDALDGAKLPRVTFHDLRHSAASMMAHEGVSPAVAASILGHAHVATTMDVYTHIIEDAQREAVARVARGLNRDD